MPRSDPPSPYSSLHHYPADKQHFSFDNSVAPIFPDMARRSIPNYDAAHAIHARILLDYFVKSGCSILDIGASRGGFYRHLFDEVAERNKKDGYSWPVPVAAYACDISRPMCDLMALEFPSVSVSRRDASSTEFFEYGESYDIINCTYVLQFIPPNRQIQTLRAIAAAVRPGGVLILGQKDASDTRLGGMLHEEYIRFRLRNGYTMEEIEAKTLALQSSMWPMDNTTLRALLAHQGFSEVRETTRSTVFSTIMCIK